MDINFLQPDPFSQFKDWFEEAKQKQIIEFNAMALATSSKEGLPSCRIVLLKGINSEGFSFFTHYDSRKGKDLAENPFACATFYWRELEKQIIISGEVKKISEEESIAYFASRPRGSQLGAWASRQDQILASRKELEEKYWTFEEMYREKAIPKPPYWGGYRLIPNRFEFWQGQPHRLHDRFQYSLENQKWEINRLSP